MLIKMVTTVIIIIIHLTMKITMATSKLAAWITMSNQQRIK